MNSEYLTWPTYYCPPAQANESALEFDARTWAAMWHKDQVRKYTGEPYINHPAEVVAILRTVPHTEEMLAAAWLHDVVEDCQITFGQVDDLFGGDIARLVAWLTDVSVPSDGNRTIRKALDRDHISNAGHEAKTIKLADIISNSKSIFAYDKAFAKVYMPEKRALLEVLKDGDQTLWNEADRICREAGY